MWHRAHGSQEARKANGCSSLAPRQARGYKLYINTVVPNLRLSDVVASRELQSSLSSCSHATRVMVAVYEGCHPSAEPQILSVLQPPFHVSPRTSGEHGHTTTCRPSWDCTFAEVRFPLQFPVPSSPYFQSSISSSSFWTCTAMSKSIISSRGRHSFVYTRFESLMSRCAIPFL